MKTSSGAARNAGHRIDEFRELQPFADVALIELRSNRMATI
jgi:hypothetical protein